LKNEKKIYFVSDAHLGLPSYKASRNREKKLVKWLDMVKHDAEEIYMMGDIFDFWWEYKRVVPRGFTRLLGKMAEITDSGIPIHFFVGNHDVWVFDYLPEETGIIVHKKPVETEFNGKSFFLAHGDGLGKGQFTYSIIKFAFHNKILQWLFARLHPNFAMWLGNKWSVSSRDMKGITIPFLGKEKEHLYQFAKETLKTKHFDYFVFGHRHLMIDMEIGKNTRYINLGEWIQNFSYGIFNGDKFELRRFND